MSFTTDLNNGVGGAGGATGTLDALKLINFQAAMIANQVPDTGHVNPVVSGVTYVHNTTLSSLTAPDSGATVGVDMVHLFSLTDATADGTYLIGRFGLENISATGRRFPVVVFGQGLTNVDWNTSPAPAISYGIVSSLTKLVISVSVLVENGKALFSVGSSSFHPVDLEYYGENDMSNAIFTLSSTPLDVYFSLGSDAGEEGLAFNLLPASYTDLS